MGFFVAALPVLPGKEGRVKAYKEELAKHEKRYEELNKAAGLKRHMEFLQQTPMGATVITVFEADDPAKLGRAFSDDAYDMWWTGRIQDTHGFDIKKGFAPPKVTVLLDWKAPGVR
jgi:hypothetical protein